jgi:predicted short-subunit dehydrogenase-like oxidoreductase (DUF2520 family)
VLGTAAALTVSPAANADAKRLNDVVVANVDTVQHQADCATDLKINPPLRLVALWHADDVLNNRLWTTTSWSDGSTVQDRANAAGYKGVASETVAINPALAISGLEIKKLLVLPAGLHRDHVELRQHPNRFVVGEQPRPHRRSRDPCVPG